MRCVRRWFVIGLLVLVGLAGAGCSRESSKTAGRLTIDGRAEVALASGELRTVDRARTLKSGEQVRMLDGAAQLSLGRGREIELRRDSVVRLAVGEALTGRPESRAELVGGDVLVVATGDAATVVAGDSTVQVTGAAKVAKDLAVVVSVYEGAAGVESAGRTVSVPALRQVTVPAPGLPSRPTPLAATASDPWDQRYLGDAIDLGSQLAARSRGLSAQLTSLPAPVAFFRQILPGLAGQPFDESLLTPGRPPGETLVGAAITLESTRGAFPERWASVFSFHDDGAPWGLVALDQNVSRVDLLRSVDAAIARVPGGGGQSVAGATGGATGGVAGGATGGVAAAPAGPSTTTGPAVPSTGGNTFTIPPAAGGASPPAPPPPSSPPGAPTTVPPPSASDPTPPLATPGPLNTGIPLLDDTVRALVEALTGLLGELGLT